MEKDEMIKMVMQKTGTNEKDAESALERTGWNVIDAVIYIERRKNPKSSDIDIAAEDKDKKSNEEKSRGIGAIIAMIFRFIGRVIKAGNEHFFEINKENEKPIKISLTVFVVLFIFLSIPMIILLIIGLFCEYKYSISSTKGSYDGINNIFNNASKSAEDIKKDFKEGYEG